MFLLVGVILITVTGSKSSPDYTIDEIKTLMGAPGFIGYVIICAIAIVALYLFQRYCAGIRRKFGPWSPQYLRVHKMHVFTLPLLGGLFGGQTIWSAKAVVEMIKTTALGNNQLIYFGFYALFITTIVLVLSQLHFLTMGLEFAPALIAVPVFQSVLIVMSIIGGGVLYNEFAALTGVEIGIFMLGLIIMLFGMWLLSKRKLVVPAPPSKMALYNIIIRFIARTRSTLRMQEAEKWPNRLHSYSCVCDCHAAVLSGESAGVHLHSAAGSDGSDGSGAAATAAPPLPPPGLGAGRAAAIAALGELEAADDNDELDYALAKQAAAARVQQGSTRASRVREQEQGAAGGDEPALEHALEHALSPHTAPTPLNHERGEQRFKRALERALARQRAAPATQRRPAAARRAPLIAP